MKNSGIYITFILILVLGVFFILFGINYEKKEHDFKKNAGVVTARIYQNSISNHKQVLYIKYYVNGEGYDGVVSSYNKKQYGSSVKIYYDKNNPTIYTLGNIKYEGYLFILLDIISISFIIRMVIDEKQ